MVGLATLALVLGAFAVASYFFFSSSWRAVAAENVAVYGSERDAAYSGSQTIKTEPAISALKQGEQVAVLWDTYGKDYWACYIRSSENQRGWVLCTSLRQT